MREDPYLQQLRDALASYALKSPRERLDALIRRGIIDEQGNVLVRMTVPPGMEDEPDAVEDQPGPTD